MSTTMQTADVRKIHAEDVNPRKRIRILDGDMSYVDVGAGDPVVFLHGNPTSSYLWRNVIPHLSSHARCLAPDLIGMGKSSKPHLAYHFNDHVQYLDEWFHTMGLQQHVTLVLHDWGSALGFHWAYRNPGAIKAIVHMESIVQPRRWTDFPHGRDAFFRALRSEKGEGMILNENAFIEAVLPKSILRTLTEAEMDAYRAPFRNKVDRLPTLQFPRLLPIEGEPAGMVDIVSNYGTWMAGSTFPKLLINAEPGALLTGRNLAFARTWPNQTEVTVRGIHYIQEDSPHEIGEAIRTFYAGLK